MRTTTGLLVVLLLAGCAGSSKGLPPADEPSSGAPSSTAPSSSSPPAAPSTSSTTARAVYYLKDTQTGPRLYREFHRRPATTSVVRDAVTAMLTEPAQDSDYTSLWPRGTTVRGARVDGATAFVDLSSQAREGGSAGGSFEELSLQQLVHTVTAAAPSVRQVQLLVEGHVVPTLWGHASTDRPIARGKSYEVLGPVWVLTTGTVRRGETFGGEATVFEATVSWEWRQGGQVIRRGFTTASTGAPGRGTWSATVDVPPGEYVLRAFESSAKDGSVQYVDDKPVRVIA